MATAPNDIRMSGVLRCHCLPRRHSLSIHKNSELHTGPQQLLSSKVVLRRDKWASRPVMLEPTGGPCSKPIITVIICTEDPCIEGQCTQDLRTCTLRASGSSKSKIRVPEPGSCRWPPHTPTRETTLTWRQKVTTLANSVNLVSPLGLPASRYK